MGERKTIYLAGGCFWGCQKFFDQFVGVLETEVGYANGPEGPVSYEEVCRNSGHAETVRIAYDESRISLGKLLEYYFMVIDPLAVNRQGHDTGIQYRTGIYYEEESQLPEIMAVYEAEEKKAGAKLAVEVGPLENFFPAEEYHQKYLDKNPGGYCHIPAAKLDLKSSGETVFRVMTEADYDKVYALWMSCKNMGFNNVDDSREGIAKYLRRNPGTSFVAERQERIVGVILAGNDGRRGFIHHMAVAEDCRRQGIAAELLRHALDALKEEGISKVALLVFNRNEAGNRFWESQGFTARTDLTYRNLALTELVRIDT